jgi:hypothetical protein
MKRSKNADGTRFSYPVAVAALTLATITDLRMATAYLPPHSSTTAAAQPADANPASIIKPRWPEMTLLFATLGLYVVAYASGDRMINGMNYVGPFLLTIALILGCLAMVKAHVSAIWTTILWMRVALIVYFGAGSIIIFFVNDETRDLMERFFVFFTGDVLKFNIIVCLFAIVFLMTILAITTLLERRSRLPGRASMFWRPQTSGLPLKTMGFLFLWVGVFVNYTISLPFRLGLFQGTFPVVVSEIGYAAQIGYFMVTLWSLREGSKWHYFAIAFALLDSLIGILSFAKGQAIFPLLMIAIAYVYHRPTISRVALSGGALTAFFLILSPAISYARSATIQGTEDLSLQTMGQRVGVLANYFTGNVSAGSETEIQTGWARLSYVNAGTFAINRYDNGQPGNSLKDIFIVWVPRIIYRTKPIITDVAVQFSVEATGNDRTAATPTIPAEAYWTLGWGGVVLIAFLTGIVATLWSLYSLQVIAGEAWYLFSVVLIGMRVGTRLDGYFVVDIVGPVGMAVIAHIFLTFLNRLVLPAR